MALDPRVQFMHLLGALVLGLALGCVYDLLRPPRRRLGRLCEALPFDLLLTGHQHIPVVGKRWHGTHVVQTPYNALAAVKAMPEGQKWLAGKEPKKVIFVPKKIM